MNFTNIKSFMIGDNEVIRITNASNIVLWEKPATGYNLLDASAVKDTNAFINRNNGNPTAPSATGGTWRYSDYIPVTAGTSYYFGEINATATTAGSAWYDSEKNYISGVNATALTNANNILTAPNNAAFLRHSWRIDEGYNANWETTVYICINGTLDHWVPYVSQ